jgi:hypothetical protein
VSENTRNAHLVVSCTQAEYVDRTSVTTGPLTTSVLSALSSAMAYDPFGLHSTEACVLLSSIDGCLAVLQPMVVTAEPQPPQPAAR